MPIGNNSSLQIGQIIYVLSNKAQKIIPAIVVEEVTIKKLDGNETSWKVSVGPTGKEKIIDSKRLDGELYATLDEVESILKQRLEHFIQTIVQDAARRADAWYGSKHELIQKIENKEAKIDPNSLIEDDVVPTNSVPTKTIETKNKNQVISKAQTAKEVRNKLIAAMSEEVGDTSEQIDQETIQLPDGNLVKVNIRT